LELVYIHTRRNNIINLRTANKTKKKNFCAKKEKSKDKFFEKIILFLHKKFFVQQQCTRVTVAGALIGGETMPFFFEDNSEARKG